MRRIATSCAVFLLAFAAASLQADGPRALIDTPVLALGTVARGTLAEGVVVVRNQGSRILRVELARMSNGIAVGDLPLDIQPGGTARIRLAARTDNVTGLFRGELVLALNDPALPEAVVTIVCRVADPIEVTPRGGFAVSVLRGQVQEAAVEIVSHERAPLQLGAIEHARDRFGTRLEVLEPGRRYRLLLVMQGDGPPEVRTDTISVQTSSSAMPRLEIRASTTVRERVRVWPASLDLGTIRLTDAAKASPVARQTLVVTREGPDDFSVVFETNLLLLDIQARRAPGTPRWHASLALKPELLYAGPISGYIFVQTSDPETPIVSVPVVGEIVP